MNWLLALVSDWLGKPGDGSRTAFPEHADKNATSGRWHEGLGNLSSGVVGVSYPKTDCHFSDCDLLPGKFPVPRLFH